MLYLTHKWYKLLEKRIAGLKPPIYIQTCLSLSVLLPGFQNWPRKVFLSICFKIKFYNSLVNSTHWLDPFSNWHKQLLDKSEKNKLSSSFLLPHLLPSFPLSSSITNLLVFLVLSTMLSLSTWSFWSLAEAPDVSLFSTFFLMIWPWLGSPSSYLLERKLVLQQQSLHSYTLCQCAVQFLVSSTSTVCSPLELAGSPSRVRLASSCWLVIPPGWPQG